MKRCWTPVVMLFLAAAAPGGPVMVADFDDGAQGVRVRESVEGSVRFRLVEDDERGGFLAVDFTRGENAGYAYVYLPITEALSKSAAVHDGISFMVKGDGSENFGMIEIRCDGYVNIFQAVFPLDCTQWRRVDLRWDEFFQINDGVREAEINWEALDVFALGSRAMWNSCSYAIDDVALASIEPRRPRPAREGMRDLAATVGKLKEGAALTMVALGDSITYGTKVPRAEREEALYFAQAARGLEKRFPGARVKAINAGRGGDTIAEGLLRIGHDVAARDPDLVTVYLGANDAFYDLTESRVRHTVWLLVDKLLETTDADILLLGPTQIAEKPGVPEAYGAVYAEIARERGVAFLDLSDVLSTLTEADFKRAFADNVHLSAYGHRVVGEAIVDFIVEKAAR